MPLQLFALLPLLAIAVQDWRRRSFHVGWLLAYAAVVLLAYTFPSTETYLNLACLTTVLAVCQAYLLLTGRTEPLTRNFLGSGDILLFIVAAPTLSTNQYLLTIILASLGGIVLSLAAKRLGRSLATIPLATTIAAVLAYFTLTSLP